MKMLLALILISPLAFFGQTQLTPQYHPAARDMPGTIIVPAADFLANIPAGDTNDGRFPDGTWFFNDSTINMNVATDVTAIVPVKKAGSYRLFVRSIGTPTSSFEVEIDGKKDPGTYGRGTLAFVHGGHYSLKEGNIKIRLTSIHPRPSLNVLVLSQDADFKESSLKDLELPPEVRLLNQYTIVPSNIIKFGDIDGSGRYAIVDILDDYSTIVYANDGHELWRWQAPPRTAGDPRGNEAAGVLWDFHETGRDELAHWRLIDGKEWVVIADGRTGEIIKKAPWPSPPLPHVDNNYRMAVAKFHKDSKAADTLLVFADTGGNISLTAYDRDLNLVWQHAEPRDKDYFGHYIYPFDVDGDGVDEVVISHLCLDSQGKEIWNNSRFFAKNNDHMDAMEFFDIDGDGHPELLVGQSDVGTLAYDARTGSMLWQNLADHTQQITAGYILDGWKTPQVVAGGRTYLPPPARTGSAGGARVRPIRSPNEIASGGGLASQLYWFDSKGDLLERWPAHPLIGNPNFVRGDWFGTGQRTYFWYRFKLEPDGGATLYFKGEAYHMFDFQHIGSDQVLTLDNGGAGGGDRSGAGQTLRIYGYAKASPHPQKCDAQCRRVIANHTHY